MNDETRFRACLIWNFPKVKTTTPKPIVLLYAFVLSVDISLNCCIEDFYAARLAPLIQHDPTIPSFPFSEMAKRVRMEHFSGSKMLPVQDPVHIQLRLLLAHLEPEAVWHWLSWLHETPCLILFQQWTASNPAGAALKNPPKHLVYQGHHVQPLGLRQDALVTG